MAVNFTTNVGLAKPTESELARNWTRFSDLVEFNNDIIEDKADINMQVYTPVMKGATSDPNLGTGGTTGRYQDFQGFILGWATVTFFDSGIVAGSGELAISLPVLADGAFHVLGTAFNQTGGNLSIIGEGYIRDNTVVDNCGSVALDCVTVSGVSYARMLTEAYTGKTNRFVTGTAPFTSAHADAYSIHYFYKKL